MTTVTPINLFGILRAILTVLLGLTIIWALSLLIFRDTVVSQWLAALFLLMAVALGPLVYLRFNRIRLQYDEHGFALFTGHTKVAAGQWKHFNRVSLFHRGYAQFAVRLYTADKTYVDIPVSELKLDPNTFRHFAAQMVKQHSTTDVTRHP